MTEPASFVAPGGHRRSSTCPSSCPSTTRSSTSSRKSTASARRWTRRSTATRSSSSTTDRPTVRARLALTHRRTSASSASCRTAARDRRARPGTAAARGRVTVWTDVDMTYPNDTIPQLVKELDGYDQVVGARTTEEGHDEEPARSGQVVHPPARELPHEDEDPRPQLRASARSAPTSRASTSATSRPASRASPR